MKLIIAEKPSVAENIAHCVGARNKVYGSGKAYCFEGNGYYVTSVRGHFYGLGNPTDYGYSKTFNLDELPMFPNQFKLIPISGTEEQRVLISDLMKKNDVDEIINACDAAREGELIFNHVYEAENCKKPVKRLWVSSQTDEAIRQAMDNLQPAEKYAGKLCAAKTREQLDWIIGMNLSRLYAVKDNYAHRIGRVKTPLLNIIVQRDNEIDSFVKRTSYKLKLENGAESVDEFDTPEKAQVVIDKSTGRTARIISVETNEITENRPQMFNLSALQQKANEIFDMTAKEALDTVQSLYEKKLVTYPRTDCRFLSSDMKAEILKVVENIAAQFDTKMKDYANKLIVQGLNTDKRVFDDSKLSDHHAIVITTMQYNPEKLSEKENKLYRLIAKQMLLSLDTEYRFVRTEYEIFLEDVIYKLTEDKPISLGWKAYDNPPARDALYYNYSVDDIITAMSIELDKKISQPKKHFTDGTLISVMENIDNRIEDKELKSAVSGKGIGTSATRDSFIEQLISAKYIERKGKQLISTEFGREFIASLPDNVKSVERTAEWEQQFEKIEGGASSDELYSDVVTFVKSTVQFEINNTERVSPAHTPKSERISIGKCPRCGMNIYEGKQSYYCESGKEGCGFTLWKEPKFFKDVITPEKAAQLIEGKTVSLKAESKEGTVYSADYKMDDTGMFVNLERIKTEKEVIGKCPRCGKNIYEGKLNFYCESGRDGCGFTLWKEDKYNSVVVTAKNAADLLSSGKTTVKIKRLSGTESVLFRLEDTGNYINLRKEQ